MDAEVNAERDVFVRSVDYDLWRRLRIVALQRNITVGEMLNHVILTWLEREEMRPH